MSNMINRLGFRNFCLNNFPFLEKDFDALTDYELISKIFEYFENQIKEIDEKYSDILDIRQEFEEFKNEINVILAGYQLEINQEVDEKLTEVDTKLQQNYAQIVQLLSDYQTLFNSELANVQATLEQEIREIELR